MLRWDRGSCYGAEVEVFLRHSLETIKEIITSTTSVMEHIASSSNETMNTIQELQPNNKNYELKVAKFEPDSTLFAI